MFPSTKILNFSCHIQIVGSELAINNRKTLIRPALYQQFRQVVGEVGSGLGNIFSAFLGPVSISIV